MHIDSQKVICNPLSLGGSCIHFFRGVSSPSGPLLLPLPSRSPLVPPLDPREELNHFPDPEIQAPFESGFPLPKPQKSRRLPPGGGIYDVPHYLTFSQIVNYASRTYRYTFDE